MNNLAVDENVRAILTSRVYDVAVESPLDHAAKLSRNVGCDVYLKREDLQPVHSFKLRGAYNKIIQLSDKEKDRGVIAASAGNHAQGVALAAKKIGISALIVMPRTTPDIKIDAVKSYGAEIELYGDNYSEAAEYCKNRVKETGRTFVHAYDDPLVIAGQGTIGKEILEQLPSVTHVFVSVGGGGLIAGVACYIKSLKPEVKIISVEPVESNCLAASIAAGKRVELPWVGIFADGVAVKQVGKLTFDIARRYVDDFMTVTTDQICSAMKTVFEDTRSIVEPAGALGVAGIQNYALPPEAKVVAICSGANIGFDRLGQIAERTLLGSGKEALLSVTMPEKPGALQHFCKSVVQNRSITEFCYRLDRRESANVLIGLSINGQKDYAKLTEKLSKHEYSFVDLSGDDVAKEHVRHMVGGHAAEAESEMVYQVEFPERPRALIEFLIAMGSLWNISLFHYRSTAGDAGNVLIGFEAGNRKELEKALQKTGYKYSYMSDNEGIRMYLS